MNDSERPQHEAHQNGQMDLLQYLDAEYWHNEAVGWLEKVKEEGTRPPAR